MKAEIIMVVDGKEYVYGTYPFGNAAEKERVNQIAEMVRDQRKIEVYVAKV